MQTIEIGPRTKVEVFSSIKELPIRISKEFNKYYLQDAGIGSSIADVDEHLIKLNAFAQQGDLESVVTESANLRFNFFAILEKWNFKTLSFACLIKTIYRRKTEKEQVVRSERLSLRDRLIGKKETWIEQKEVLGEWQPFTVFDYTANALNDLLDQLSDEGLTVGTASDYVDQIKKNLMPNASSISRNSLEPI